MKTGMMVKTLVFGTAAVLLAFSQVASARNDGALNGFRNHALPVLVRVNAQGHVTDVQPSVSMTPKTRRLLRANLEEMIVKPAMFKGHPVSSVFVIQLALHAQKMPDGTYRAHFSYVSSLPVPAGNWYWLHVDGRRLALVQDEGGWTPPHRTLQDWRRRRVYNVRPGLVPTPSSQGVAPAFHSSQPVIRQGRPKSRSVH